MNRAALTLLRYPDAGELLGRNMHETIHHTRPDGSHYPIAACPLLSTLTSGHAVRLDNELLWRKDGTSFLAEYSSFPVFADGAVTGSVITFNDVSVRQTAQRRLALQNAVGQVLAASSDLKTAPGQILAAIGTAFEWAAGAFWLSSARDPGGRTGLALRGHLVRAGSARRLSPPLDEALRATSRSVVSQNEIARPLRAIDLRSGGQLDHHRVAARQGLAAALAFPVEAGGDTLGLLEFFGRKPIVVDQGLREMLATLGQQIGEFIRRRRVEEDLHASEALKGAILETALDCIIAVGPDSRIPRV